MDSRELTDLVKQSATTMGFDLVRITSADRFEEDEEITRARVRRGLMNGLPWYTESRVSRGANPGELLPGARSIISLGMSYLPPDGQGPDEQRADEQQAEGAGLRGRVAVYAWGKDYHRVLKGRMKALVEDVSARLGKDIRSRWYVDDGPMLDRAVAQRAGTGWFGKNTNILTSGFGSWVFLSQVITDLELIPDPPLAKTCGSCTRCLTACPTDAFTSAYELDNTRCISYLTIEHRGAIPHELRPLMQDWVFGCDICQDVCPVNRKASATGEPAFQETGFASLDLVGVLEMSEEQFREQFRHSPIKRAKRAGLQRNACVALGNIGDQEAVAPLSRVLSEGELVVRCHAAWALGRIGGRDAREALNAALRNEGDPDVMDEIRQALQGMGASEG